MPRCSLDEYDSARSSDSQRRRLYCYTNAAAVTVTHQSPRQKRNRSVNQSTWIFTTYGGKDWREGGAERSEKRTKVGKY